MKTVKLFGIILIMAGIGLFLSQNISGLQIVPDFCDSHFPNELYENYNSYEIWMCTDTSFDPQEGLVHTPIYYEKTHPNESWSYDVIDVESWIEVNLPSDGNGDGNGNGNGADGEDGCPFCGYLMWLSFAMIGTGCLIVYLTREH